jgi:hypothetical protein
VNFNVYNYFNIKVVGFNLEILKSIEYQSWIDEIKEKIRSAQIKTALKVNTEMLNLYWYIDISISEKLTISNWGTKVVKMVSKDLQQAFPNFEGFSRRNLLFMKPWVEFYQSIDNEFTVIAKQVVSQLHDGTNNNLKIWKSGPHVGSKLNNAIFQ